MFGAARRHSRARPGRASPELHREPLTTHGVTGHHDQQAVRTEGAFHHGSHGHSAPWTGRRCDDIGHIGNYGLTTLIRREPSTKCLVLTSPSEAPDHPERE